MPRTFCPICKSDVEVLSYKYMNIVCKDCVEQYEKYGVNGNQIEFTTDKNGFRSLTKLDREQIEIGKNNTCYINGLLCIAEEGPYCGIIFMCYDNPNKRKRHI